MTTPSPAVQAAERPAPERPRVLVVDDDPPVRRALARVLQTLGMEVTEAASGEDALARIAADGSFPLVITDLRMPGLDGLGLLKAVLVEHPDTVVLVITGVAEVETAVECLKLGALDYLSKPVLVEEVRARVNSALEKRRLELENRWLQKSYQERLEARIREMTHKAQEQFLGQIQMAVRMLEAKDVYTRGHSQRVAIYSTRTAIQLGIAGNPLDQIQLGGELHDIGKIGTRDIVLNKPGPLTAEEFEEIKRHVIEGEEILEPLRKEHPAVLQIVRWHHEHLDGRGFPDGLKGGNIPQTARIVSVADAFDAMTTTRAYRPPRSPAEGVDELLRCSGTQFDPDVVQAFLRAFPDVDRLPVDPRSARA